MLYMYIDVTTVLLVDNNNRVAHGRFLNVKPAVGLLTSTARTFIQDGVTTEYATQVLGTTLDHGRLYAQLISKSSRVLYNKNNVADSNSINPTSTISFNPFNQIPITQLSAHNNEITLNGDDRNMNNNNNNHTQKLDDENVVTFIKNTDYIAPDRPSIIYPSTATNVFNFTRQVPQFDFEFLPVSLAQVQENPFEANAKVKESFSVSQSSSSSRSSNNGKGEVVNDKNGVNPDKVKLGFDLPTYTVKHDYLNYFWDDPDTDIYLSQQKGYSTEGSQEDDSDESYVPRENHFSFAGSPQAIDQQQNRIGKMLYRGNAPVGIANDIKPLTSVTYYGFADFTTVVGNTVIIFSPNTAASAATGHVTSIRGEATLHHLATKVKSPGIKPTGIKEILHTQHVHHHKVNALPVPNRKSKADSEEKTKTTTPAPKEIIGTTIIFEDEDNDLVSTTPSLPNVKNVDQKLEQNLLSDTTTTTEGSVEQEDLVIEPSEVSIVSAAPVTSHTTMLSIPSEEDIAKIFASLKAASESSSKLPENEKSINNAETQVTGGATTIFFEDDPFLVTSSTSATSETQQINPSSTVSSVFASTVTPSTESEIPETTTFSDCTEESTETTNSPVTENNTDFDAQEPSTTENNLEIVTGKIKENEEQQHAEEQSIKCPTGFVSNPTTAYKTFTYLTTFFIPTDDEQSTSSSVQSSEVVQTDVSYECSQTEAVEIKPTSTVIFKNLLQQTATRSKLFGLNRNTEKPPAETTTRESVLKPKLRNKLFQNRFKGTTPPTTTTTSGKIITTTEQNPDIEQEEDTEKIPVVSGKKHVEDFSEHINLPTTTDPPASVTEHSGADDNDEIELIYKTLYTTYTYLTTFFHESTSSISSRTEVITNIVTSTLDNSLIKTDSALADLVASMTETIRPTSVGIGRPTTTYELDGRLSEADIDELSPDHSLRESTPNLDTSILENEVKTYYTTYTYYTSIFGDDGETEILSRTEVYTNYVGQTIKPTKLIEDDKLFSTSITPQPINKDYDITAQRKKNVADNKITGSGSAEDAFDNNVIQLSYSTMVRTPEPVDTTTVSSENGDSEATTSNVNESSSNITTKSSKMSTDVRSSSSNGDRHIIENIRKQFNNLLEDQISSESNNEEIMPSPTLLLQTSYTTFTYFTTQYLDDKASNVLSRLETITNVVTETLSPTETIAAEDASLPITYFTTFTYW